MMTKTLMKDLVMDVVVLQLPVPQDRKALQDQPDQQDLR